MARLVLAVVSSLLVYLAAAKDPDLGLRMVDIVRSKGYEIEESYATTPDGFVLRLFRIPRGTHQPAKERAAPKPVVFINHALLDSSWAFVANSPEESLGYILADAGFDVWFGNNRGNVYSRNHTSLSPSSAAFWNFSFDEMALLDLPTHLNHVLKATGAQNLSYVGHSQGTIQAFAGFSLAANRAVAERVNLFVALAPVAYVHNQRGFLLNLVADFGVDKAFQALGVKEFLPGTKFLNKIGPAACKLLPTGCDTFLDLICGPSQHLNKSRIDVYVGQTPAGTSVRNMVHWAQGIRHDGFRHYDWGSAARNVAHYGAPTPPDYELSALRVPVALCSGGDDYLADPKDVDRLESELSPGVLVKRIDLPSYAHLDFSWGFDAHTLLYPQVLDLLRRAARGEFARAVSYL